MIEGKGTYIWRIKDCEDGNIPNIVTMCQNANFSHVVIKIADGTVGYNFTTEDGDMAKELAQALQAVGIEPWGYQFVYGNMQGTEAETANRRVKETGVVGFVINAEGDYKDKSSEAWTYVRLLKLEIPIALSSYRYPEVHPELPWKAFLSVCDFVMPQVYWMDAHDPAVQLRECLRQYAKITDLPIVPTGSAFCEHGWCPTNEEIEEFATEALGLGLPGINFWEWNAMRRGGFWKTVRDIEYTLEEPPVGCCEELWEGLLDLGKKVGAVASWWDMIKDTNEKAYANATAIDVLNKTLERYYQMTIGYCDRYKELANEVEANAIEIKELEKKIENIIIQCDHTHPRWMVKLGLVK